MTKDYTLAVDELRRHYVELTVLKKTVRAQVKAEFEPKIDFEIQRRIEAEEIKFANHLAAVKEREDMPINVIQDHVIRSRTWNRWEKWRDLAGLQPETVTAEDARNAKRGANAATIFDRDALTLTVRKDQNGKTLETPVVYDLTTVRRIGPSRDMWNALPHDEDLDMAVRREAGQPYFRYLSNEIDRLIEAGEVADPRENG